MDFTDDEDGAAGSPIFGSGLGYTTDGEQLAFDAPSSPDASLASARSASDTGNDDVEMSDEDGSTLHPDADMSDDNASIVPSDQDYCECTDCDQGAAGFGFHTTDDYHAANCWDKDCEQCQARRPGVQDWHADHRPDCTDPFIDDDSKMVQTYVDGFNRVGIMPNRELVNLMKSSSRSGRRLRDLKKALGPEMDEARTQMNIGLTAMKDLKERLRVLDKDIEEFKEGGKEDELANLRKMRRKLRLEYTDACEVYAEQRAILEPLLETLKSEERMWVSTLRKLSYKQDALLTSAGLLNDDDDVEPEWTDEQYQLESVGHQPEMLEFEEEEEEEEKVDEAFQQFVQQQADAAQPVEPPTEAEEAAQIERKEKNESFERAIEVAREANETHRDRYKILFAEYVAQQNKAGRTATDLEYADEFTYPYLKEGQKLSAVVKEAEQALIAFETTVWAEVPGGYRLELDTTGYHKYAKRHENAIMEEARDSLKTLNGPKIEEWKEDVPMEEGDWTETILDEPEVIPEVIEDEMAVVIEDEVAVVNEDALDADDEPEPAPKKRSRKRGADKDFEAKGVKKRRANEDGEVAAAPVTRVEHKYNLRARKAPDPTLAPKKRVSRKGKGKDAGKVAAKGKLPAVEDGDEDVVANAPVAKKSKGKGKQPLVEDADEDDVPVASKGKGKGKQPLIQDNDNDEAPGPSAAKKQPAVERVRSPSPAPSDSNKDGNKNRFDDLAEIPLFAPNAISRPLDMDAQLAAGNTICEAEDDGRFRIDLWRNKSGYKWL